MDNVFLFGTLGALTASAGMFWSSIKEAFASVRRFIIVEHTIVDGSQIAQWGVWHNLLNDFQPVLGNPWLWYYVKYYEGSQRKEKWVRIGEGLMKHRTKMVFIHMSVPQDMGSYMKLHYLRGSLKIEDYTTGKDLGMVMKKFPRLPFDIKYLKGADKSSSNNTAELDSFKPGAKRIYAPESWYAFQNTDGTPFTDSLFPLCNQSGETGYILGDDLKELEDEIVKWLDMETWYSERQIAWKRGYGLHGLPGTGKTAFVRHIGMKFGLPLRILDLQSFNSNHELAESVQGLPDSHILLIEDVDAVFRGRELVSKNTNKDLTFDGLLNALDGVKSFNGLVFVTTNDISALDPALLRPGRLDRVVEVGLPDDSQRGKIAEKILVSDFDDVVLATEGFTCAKVQEYCVKIALDNLWKNEKV